MKVELCPGLFIQLPDIGVTFEIDKRTPGIDFKRGEKELSVWMWRGEITIDKQYYKIEGDKLVEIDNKRRIIPLVFPIKKGEKGEVIIDLSLINGNKKIEKFLRE